MASTYLERNMTGNTASTKMTFSCWLKISNPSTNGRIFGAQANACHSYWNGDGRLNVDFAAKDSGSVSAKLLTTRKFRDTNAWYHIVFSLDTTLGTANDRIKLWVNGVQETAFDTLTAANSNATYAYGQSGYYNVGARSNNTGSAGHYFDGLMSHVHYCDGYAYAASDFGSTDSTTGEWKINVSPSVSYGTNGFFILKDGNSGTDQSPNSNDFTVAGGTLTNTEDCPSNVFNTNNPLIHQSANGNHSYGNTNWSTGAASWRMCIGNIGATSGKYYAECQVYGSGGNVHWMNGIVSLDQDYVHTNQYGGGDSGKLGASYNWDGQKYVNGSNANYGASYGNNDIIGIAMDLDNRKLYFSKNGTWQNSGVPTSGSTGTGAIDIPSSTDPYTFSFSAHNSSMNCNFGNGYFGGNAVSSAGTNASGIGIFEYDVPTGYTALSTKGLNE